MKNSPLSRKKTHQPLPENDTAIEKPANPVLLVIAEASRPKMALLRAHRFAQRIDAPLFVAACMAESQRVNMLFPQRHTLELNDRFSKEVVVHRRVWRWCNTKLLDPLTLENVIVTRGLFALCAAATASKLKAQLIVLSETDIESGHDVTAIVEDAGVSVLVSRAARPKNTVIAATDMTLKSFPVVRKGAEVAKILGAPLTIVHNIEPQPLAPVIMGPEAPIYFPIMTDIDSATLRKRRSSLLASADAAPDGSDIEVLDQVDTVNAILGLARSQQADLIVVGHRRRSWLQKVFGDAVAERVINRSIRSIMVVPIGKGRFHVKRKGNPRKP